MTSLADPASATRPSPTAAGPGWRPLVAAAVTMVLWASAFVVIRGLRDVLDPGPMAVGRLLVGSVVLSAIALGRRGWTRRLPRGRALVLIIGYGVLWFGIYTVAVNAAGRYLDAGTSAMLVNLAPIIVAVLAGTFLHEGFPRNLVLGLVIAFAGVAIIAGATATGQVRPTGVLLALAAAALYAVGVLLQKQALATVDPVTVTWLGALAGAVATLPFLPRLVSQAGENPWPVLPGVIFLGVFPTAIAFLLWTYALSKTSAGRMAASSYVVPGIAVLLSWIFLTEVPPVLSLVGGAVSLLGVAITRLGPRRRSAAVRTADRG
ncbi:DMT family transporter [Microlunatus ginsengisoli]|uniref:DMT family transporter n=1 Tax=Microlunatus ginsengisoli TaxID=363863 RepID=UPI0031E33D25